MLHPIGTSCRSTTSSLRFLPWDGARAAPSEPRGAWLPVCALVLLRALWSNTQRWQQEEAVRNADRLDQTGDASSPKLIRDGTIDVLPKRTGKDLF